MKTADVTVFSTLNRGVWLSNYLQNKQQVAFIDLTSKDLQREDKEGPFGFFNSPQMSLSQQEWVKPYWTPNSEGFSVLTDKQFLNFKSIFLDPVYRQRKDYQLLRNPQNKKPPFKEGWLRYLVQNLSKSLESAYFSSTDDSEELPCFQDFGVLNPHESSLLDEKVFYLSQSFSENFSDFQIKKRKKDYLILNNREILLRTQKIIWMLSPEETHKINPLLSTFFFGKRVEPTDYWQRFSFQFNFENYPFPNYFIQASPKQLPWKYEKLICAKKDLKFENKLNTWVKVPLNTLVNFEDLGQQIEKQLGSLFPYSSCKLIPQSWPPFPFLFPIYEPRSFKKIKFNSYPNIFLIWPYLDMSWNGWLKQETLIASKLSSKNSK